MKSKNKFKITQLFIFLIFLSILMGCKGYFDNPLKDKETGENINLLIVDFNFFTTRMTYKIIDASDGSLINEDVKISFSGKNRDDIVNYSGEKNADYHTTVGQIELTVDPNVQVSENTPLEFAINIEADGYNPLSKGISIPSEGIKTYEIYLSKIENQDDTDLSGNIDTSGNDTTFHFSIYETQVKSAQTEAPYVINYSITMSNILKFLGTDNKPLFKNAAEVMAIYNQDTANFSKMTISSFSEYVPGVDLVKEGESIKPVIFNKLETGTLKKLMLGGKEVGSLGSEAERGKGVIETTCTYLENPSPEVFGFFEFQNEYWIYLGKKNSYNELHFKYTLANQLTGKDGSNIELCGKGASITFSSTVESSFSIDAKVYDAVNNFIGTINFTGNFPETFFIENVPSGAGKLVFKDNNPSFKFIDSLVVNDLCNGSFNVMVEPVDNYIEYQIALKVICPSDSLVAIAPTYSGEIKLKNSSDPWQGVNMNGGVIDILGLPNSDYELRLLWEDEWEYSTYATKFDGAGNYIGPIDGDATITSLILDDGRTLIRVVKVFKQNICQDMGWVN